MIEINGYQIIAQIYEGDNSIVYRGIRQQDNLPVILKMLKQDYPTPAQLTRYRQEYEITRNLNLKGVIKAYSLEEDHRRVVIIFEDFGGNSLNKLINNSEQKQAITSLNKFLDIAIQAAEILAQIHAANVIHKDINPANLVWHSETNQLKIIDFGISTQLTRENPTLKNPNVLEGTLAYISPEQTGRMNRSLDYRTDFYSLGVTLYELLTGQLPFETNDALELVHCHIAKLPIAPNQNNPEIPKAVSDIVMKLMAKTAEERYQSAFGIGNDLAECLHELQTTGNISDLTLGTQDISEQFQIPQKLYGREAEVETLLRAFKRVAEPQKSQIEMMLVAGYCGIGKSALVKELYKPITQTRGYFICGKFDQFQRNIPYSAVVYAFQELVRQLLTETETQLKLWREKLLTALGVNGQIIIEVIPNVELIIGKQRNVPQLRGMEAQNRFNLVLGNFIRAFCSPEHPLVIFLDDLQWADAATLKLIQLMMTDSDTQYLFLIGAYRDNEVSPTHPLMMTLEEIQKATSPKSALQNLESDQPTFTKINHIKLAPLAVKHISQLIADTLYTNIESVKSLAEMVMTKTRGNPFFVNEFLKTLYAEGLLQFQHPQSSVISGCKKAETRGFWQWEVSQIETLGITDNVVELMICKLKKLPEATQNVLQLAACIGSEFDLNTLASVCQKTATTLFDYLREALQSGLILSCSELDEQLLIQNYQFSHDRVQQAAYEMIPEFKKQKTHLKIGRLLLANTPSNLIEDNIFNIVNQLNQAVNAIDNPLERKTLAELNLIAGRKAKFSIAYEPAVQYLSIGLELLCIDSWHTDYELTLAMYEAAAETAYLNGDFEQMEKLVEVVETFAKTMLEKVKVCEIKMLAYITRTRLLEATKIGLKALDLLGINLPESPSPDDIKQVLLETKALLVDKSDLDLLNLPRLTDTNKLAAMRILSILFTPIFLTTPALLPFIPCQQVQLSLQYGNNSHSALGYANYAIILNGFLQEIDSAYQFGQVALKLLSQVNYSEIKGRTLNQVGALNIHGKAHLKDTFAILLEAYQSSLENGDLEFVGYSAMNRCQYLYLGSEELIFVEKEMGNYCHALAKFNLKTSLNYNQIFWQSVLNLISYESNPGCLIGNACNEKQMLPMLLAANDRFGIFSLYLHKLILCYLFDDYTEALVNTLQAEKYVDGATGYFSVSVFYFYDSLARLAIYSSVTNLDEQEFLILKVKNNQEKMATWAYYAPMNYSQKFDLVAAEQHRILGEDRLAMDLYDRAIAQARKNHYINDEALACELAAKFWLTQGKERFAKSYINDAHYAYARWGATAKVKDLEARYPKLISKVAAATLIIDTNTTTSINTGTTSGEVLDIATVIKASQAISGVILLEQLLPNLMKILIENAGAQVGFLILESQGQLLIEAEGAVDSEQVKVLQSINIETTEKLPLGVIQYVARTQEDVVLSDATKEGVFTREPYIVRNQAKSLLCAPIINQGKLIGILYLENNLTTGVFTPDRLEVLKILSSQAAISIENARLYQNLEDKVAQRTAQLAQANQEISTLNELLKKDNLRMSAELDIVKQLQQMVLPKHSELEAIEGLEIAGFMEPADEVGGDYYDVLQQDGQVKISIGDVTGHGLESGVLMIMAQTAVRTLQKMNETDPMKFLDVLNQTLYDNLQRMESPKNMSLAILDYAGGVLKLSGQHEEMIVVRADGKLDSIDTMDLGFPIGLVEEIGEFIAQEEVLLNPGDVVVLYTDGIPEAFDINKAQYGLKRLWQVVVENRHRCAQEIREAVINDVRQYIGAQKVFDDITLVVMKQK
ncbi:AAA family ATPase [Microcoleus sp. F10-C6]|uniref:protein kinase domain-containing protein n=1 Tax=unclassified Microcoleus TaxID=2642155 RepID=UPI002FD26B61